MMSLNRNEAKAEVIQLPSGFWAVFIDGDFVYAASTSEEASHAKLNQFLKTIKGGEEE